jgi:glycine/D-amino acid oxidase-like deaminating enzyme
MNGLSHGLWERSAPAGPATSGLSGEIRVDVVVIGAGYTGLSAALHLAGRRVSVAVLEAAQIGFGGSGRNVGLVNAGLWLMPEVVTQRLGTTYGPRLLERLAEAPARVFGLIGRYGIACEPMRSGTLHCGVGRAGLEQLAERARQWAALRAPVELLGPADTALRTGSKIFSGALFDARAGTVQPLAYVRGLARAAMANGTALFTASAVLSAERDGETWVVRTSSGSARADWVVIATDAYAEGPWRVAREEQVHLPYFNFATAPLDEPRRGRMGHPQGAFFVPAGCCRQAHIRQCRFLARWRIRCPPAMGQARARQALSAARTHRIRAWLVRAHRNDRRWLAALPCVCTGGYRIQRV